MKNKICLLSFFMMLNGFFNLSAAQIHSYQELKSAILAGNRFVILVNMQECSGKGGFGYFAPKAMMLLPPRDKFLERVLTSDLHFSNYSGSPTYEYVKYTFNSDNTVTIDTSFYEPNDFKSIGIHTLSTVL